MTKRDREGRDIGLEEWGRLWSDFGYRLVAEERVDGCVVRTVWEGMDEFPGAMYYTGIAEGGGGFVTVASAGTESQATQAHLRVVEFLRRESGPGATRRVRQALAADLEIGSQVIAARPGDSLFLE